MILNTNPPIDPERIWTRTRTPTCLRLTTTGLLRDLNTSIEGRRGPNSLDLLTHANCHDNPAFSKFKLCIQNLPGSQIL